MRRRRTRRGRRGVASRAAFPRGHRPRPGCPRTPPAAPARAHILLRLLLLLLRRSTLPRPPPSSLRPPPRQLLIPVFLPSYPCIHSSLLSFVKQSHHSFDIAPFRGMIDSSDIAPKRRQSVSKKPSRNIPRDANEHLRGVRPTTQARWRHGRRQPDAASIF